MHPAALDPGPYSPNYLARHGPTKAIMCTTLHQSALGFVGRVPKDDTATWPLLKFDRQHGVLSLYSTGNGIHVGYPMQMKWIQAAWPTRETMRGDPTQPIFHLLAVGRGGVIGTRVGLTGTHLGSVRLFRHQHVRQLNLPALGAEPKCHNMRSKR